MKEFAVAVALAALLAAPAHAQRLVFGFQFGVPLYWPAPYYVYPPPVIYSTPVYTPYVYVPPPQPAYYFYCAASGGYYPYVRDCPQGWQRVPAEPPR